MRDLALSVLIIASCCVVSIAQDTDERKTRIAESRKMAKREAEAYVLRLAVDGEEQWKLRQEPIQYWTNPVDGEIHGSVFVWTRDGRPGAVAPMYRYYSPKQQFAVEFQSLSEKRLAVSKDGEDVWSPPAGVEFVAMPDSIEPAATLPSRLRQMQSHTRRFTADLTDYDDVTRLLRVLSRPLYRYKDTLPGVLDGAMFTFGSCTDPEILLLIEARRVESGFQWHYALARLSVMQLRVKYREQLVLAL